DVAFIPDRDHDDRPDSAPVVALDGFAVSNNNVVNNLHWGPDGWLYGAIGVDEISPVGAPGSDDAARTPISRGIWRYHPPSKRFEKIAEGMVNPWGADFNAWGDLFTVNTVIAHLWHIVPNMVCQRREGEAQRPYAYEPIQSIADHLHWGGGAWQSSRGGQGVHSVAGGGHAHCGATIYLGDNWPDEYRGTLLTCNFHGTRLNNDRLDPHGSTYVGVHRPDIFFANDPWFRGLSVKYGPDGGVYVSDWHDFGECHDTDGSHRSTGRIYKIVWGQPATESVDLQQASDVELAEMHAAKNEWHVRRARRILAGRAANRPLEPHAVERLSRQLESKDCILRLRALWTLNLTGDLAPHRLFDLLGDADEHVRRWAMRIVVERSRTRELPDGLAQRWTQAAIEHASGDPSASVRLTLASSLPWMEETLRWQVATRLAQRPEDVGDAYLPRMVWYGMESLVTGRSDEALGLAWTCPSPLLRRLIVRRLLDVDKPSVARIVESFPADVDARRLRDALQGMLEALDVRGSQAAPPAWRAWIESDRPREPEVEALVVRLSAQFGDVDALQAMQRQISATSEPLDKRREALATLRRLHGGVTPQLLVDLVRRNDGLRAEALQAMTLASDDHTGENLLDMWPQLDEVERRMASDVLSSRREFAERLVDAVGRGDAQPRDVSAFALQRLQTFGDDAWRRKLAEIWPAEGSTRLKAERLLQYKRRMTPEFLAVGNVAEGRRQFQRVCAQCHSLFGEGGDLAPDLTGAARTDVDYLLRNLIEPSALVDPAYRLTNVITVDGRVLSGYLTQLSDRFLELRTPEGKLRVAMEDVEETIVSDQSMMPEGMWRELTDEQLRDLLLYLGSRR
ncbi:MAG: c-type cytochrome, partial [Planctomycetales bacterium]|nr:c-type cytochrome [Planctomycetales bacterium]